MGHPLSQHTIWQKVKVLSGTKPHIAWVRGFLSWHPDIALDKPSVLNPKHYQSFNHTMVEHHFELLKKILEEKGIPWENVYNMDKRNVSLEVDGKDHLRNTLFLVADTPSTRFKVQILSLSSVSVWMELAFHLALCFLTSHTYHKKWFQMNPDIWYIHLTLALMLSDCLSIVLQYHQTAGLMTSFA
ncbi:hypothetical protein HD554DRAFT_2030986 [Boletus coccyginus]|nr:hypothetical protein HD554DRAFT_2030986 [Boletus coccyginus]